MITRACASCVERKKLNETQFCADDRRSDTTVGGEFHRLVLQVYDPQSQQDNVFGHQDVHRVQDQARVRKGATGATAAERHTSVHRGRSEYIHIIYI